MGKSPKAGLDPKVVPHSPDTYGSSLAVRTYPATKMAWKCHLAVRPRKKGRDRMTGQQTLTHQQLNTKKNTLCFPKAHIIPFQSRK